MSERNGRRLPWHIMVFLSLFSTVSFITFLIDMPNAFFTSFAMLGATIFLYWSWTKGKLTTFRWISAAIFIIAVFLLSPNIQGGQYIPASISGAFTGNGTSASSGSGDSHASGYSTVGIEGEQAFLYATNGTFQREVTNACAANEYVYNITDNGTVLCRSDINGNATAVAWIFNQPLHNSSNNVYFNESNTSAYLYVTNGTFQPSGSYLTSESDPIWSGNYTACSIGQKLYFNGRSLACANDIDTFAGNNTDNLAQGVINKYDNTSWNQSLGDAIYCSLKGCTISGNMNINGNFTVIGTYANMTVYNVFSNGSIIPELDGIFDLGESGKRWNLIYAENIIGLLDCSNITGASSNLCTLIDTDTFSGNYSGYNKTAWDAAHAYVTNGTFQPSGSYITSESDPIWSGNYTACTSGQKLYFNGRSLACANDIDTFAGNWSGYNKTSWDNAYNYTINGTFTQSSDTVNWDKNESDDFYPNGSRPMTGSLNMGNNNITNAMNISSNGYYFGQPINGIVGSGILWTDNLTEDGRIKLGLPADQPLFYKYPNFLVSYNNDTEVFYFNFTSATTSAPDDIHTAAYVDIDGQIKNTTFETFFTDPDYYVTKPYLWDICVHKGDVEVYNTNYLLSRYSQLELAQAYRLHHLKPINGLGTTSESFPNITVASGKYTYLLSENEATVQNVSKGALVELVSYANGYGNFTTVNKPNFTACDGGALGTVACSNPTQYYPYLVGITGQKINGINTTQIHIILPRNGESHPNLASCRNASISSSFTMLALYKHTFVQLAKICIRPSETSWSSSTAIVDLRDFENVGVGGASVDLSPYINKDGSVTFTGSQSMGGNSIYSVNDMNATNINANKINSSGNITAEEILAKISCTRIQNGTDSNYCDDSDFNETKTNASIDARSSLMNVNSSKRWDNVEIANTTQMFNASGILSINYTWLYNVIFGWTPLFNTNSSRYINNIGLGAVTDTKYCTYNESIGNITCIAEGGSGTGATPFLNDSTQIYQIDPTKNVNLTGALLINASTKRINMSDSVDVGNNFTVYIDTLYVDSSTGAICVNCTNPLASVDVASRGWGTPLFRFRDGVNGYPVLDLSQGIAGNTNFNFYNNLGEPTVLLAAGFSSFIKTGYGLTVGTRSDPGTLMKHRMAVVNGTFEATTADAFGSSPLTNTEFDNSGFNWTRSGDCVFQTVGGNNQTNCTYSTGTGYIRQAYQNFSTTVSGDRHYRIRYYVNSSTYTDSRNGYATAIVAQTFATAGSNLILTPGQKESFFKTRELTNQNFQVTFTLSAGQSVVLENVTIDLITSGGNYTGGGQTGMVIDPSGNVTFPYNATFNGVMITDGVMSTATDSPPTCNTALKSYRYYDNSMNEYCYCNSTNYRQFDSTELCT